MTEKRPILPRKAEEGKGNGREGQGGGNHEEEELVGIIGIGVVAAGQGYRMESTC